MEGARAEFEAFWSLFEQRPDREASTWRLRVVLQRVIRLSIELLDELGVRRRDYGNRDYGRTQGISDAINFLGFDGLIVPSARFECDNLIVYYANRDGESIVEPIDFETFRWSS